MSLFGRRPAEDESLSRAYLRSAPPISRADNLAICCAQRVAELPVAQAAEFGEPLTVTALQPASDIVRRAMAQDRDLSAGIARKAAVILKSVLAGAMAGGLSDNLDTAYEAAGLRIGTTVTVADGSALPEDEREAAAALGSLCLSLVTVVGTGPDTWSQKDGSFYVSLYTGDGDTDVEALAYDLTAWIAVVIGRLGQRGLVDRRAPVFNPAFAQVPELTRAGWYPNPPKFGDTSTGDAQLQRYWDEQWTSRVRIRRGRDWSEQTHSLHDAPVD